MKISYEDTGVWDLMLLPRFFIPPYAIPARFAAAAP